MNKNVFYTLLLTIVFGLVLYYQFQTWESKLESNPKYNKSLVLKDSNYLDGFFFEEYYNENQPKNPFVSLVAGSEYLFHFSSNDSTLFYHIIEDSPANMASVKVEVYGLNIKINDDLEYGLLIEAQGLRELVGKGEIKTLSKQEITETAHECDLKMASVISLEKTNIYLLDWKYAPFSGIIGLLVLFLLIWGLRALSRFLGGYFGGSEQRVLLIFIIGILFITTYVVSINIVRTKLEFSGFADVLFSIYGLFNISGILVFVLFRYLIDKNRLKWEFVDLEFGKFIYIIFAWSVLCLIQVIVLACAYDDINRFSVFSPPLAGILIGAVIFATANFLNNFRAHYYELRRKGKSLKVARTQGLTSQSELSALQSRVNPHFLYNSLNSIAALSESNPAKTKEMALALSDFYKYGANREEEIWTTIPEEIEMIEKYIEVEKIRFGDKLRFKMFCHDNVYHYKIPKFLIQPLVENAIKYGYNTKDDQINVIVSAIADKKHKQITIAVQDSGPDFPNDMDMGHGIRSVQKKLNLTYPDDHYLSFSNKRRTQASKKDRDLYEKHKGEKLFDPEMKIATIILYKPRKDV